MKDTFYVYRLVMNPPCCVASYMLYLDCLLSTSDEPSSAIIVFYSWVVFPVYLDITPFASCDPTWPSSVTRRTPRHARRQTLPSQFPPSRSPSSKTTRSRFPRYSPC